MTFGVAVDYAKQGLAVTRKGWNGKGMFIFMRPEDTLPTHFIENVKSLPQVVKEYYRGKKEDVKFTAYLCMKAADDTIVNGWLASKTDLLSDDWEFFNHE